MKAFLALAACLLLVSACGSGEPAGEAAQETVAPPARPAERPPSLEGNDGPPPAWVETGSGTHWLAFSTFCWKRLCVDYLAAPERELPAIPTEEGELVRFHLGFEATEITLQPADGPSVELDPVEPTWTVESSGAVTLFAVAAPGAGGSDASYAAVFDTGS